MVFPITEEVFANEIGEPGITVGCDLWREAVDWVSRSITSSFEVAIPDFEESSKTRLDPSCIRFAANF